MNKFGLGVHVQHVATGKFYRITDLPRGEHYENRLEATGELAYGYLPADEKALAIKWWRSQIEMEDGRFITSEVDK